MKLYRFIAAALICLEALALGYLSETAVFPACVAVVALLGCTAFFPIGLPPRRIQSILLGLSVLFLVKWQVFPVNIPARTGITPADYGLMHAFAQFAMLAQLTALLFRTPESAGTMHSPMRSVLLWSALAVASAADFIAGDRHHIALTGFMIAFTIVYALYCLALQQPHLRGAGSRLRHGITALCLLLSLALGLGAVLSLRQNRDRMDTLLADLIAQVPVREQPGFSQTARLDSIRRAKSTRANDVALRVESKQAPGYLRALAYERYTDGQWQLPEGTETRRPSSDAPSAVAGASAAEHSFALHAAQDGPLDAMDIWPDSSLQNAIFLPEDAAWLRVPADTLELDENLAVRKIGIAPGAAYRAAASETVDETPPSEEMRRRYTAVPQDLDPRVRGLAETILAGKETTAEKIAAVTQYFHDNYTYQFGITIPPDADPLTYFLLERPPAHCEYFASGAAVLLRLGGVPCRYVVGFVAAEQNEYGDYWVARNRDAHAWVEAWDDAAGWVCVEATPANGVPTETRSSRLASLRDWVAFQVAKIRAAFRDGVPGILLALQAIVLSLGYRSYAGLALLLIAGASVIVYRRLRSRRRKGSPTPLRREVRALSKLLRSVDRSARRKGIVRGPGETLVQFSKRLAREPGAQEWHRLAAAWYRAYASVRYREPGDRSALEHLRSMRPR